MTELEQLIENVAKETDDKITSQCCHLLRALAANQLAASELWQEALQRSCGEAQRFTFVLWFGAERAKALHRLHLEQRRFARELTEVSGIKFSDTMGIIDAIDVVEAYAQPGDETGEQRADAALKTLCDRSRQLTETVVALSPG